jgi:hypothetical protein
MMVVTRSSETSVLRRAAKLHVPEDGILQILLWFAWLPKYVLEKTRSLQERSY